MRKYIDQQDSQVLRAQERARKKKEEDKADEGDETKESSYLVEDLPEVYMGAVFPSFSGPTLAIADDFEGPGGHPEKQITDSHYVNMQVFGIDLPSLLDSGAVVSLFPSEVWESMPAEKRERIPECTPGTRPLVGLGGEFSVLSIIDLPISVAGVSTLQRFFVTTAVTSPILGMDALTGLGIRINFATGEIFAEGRKQAIELATGLGVAPLCGALIKAPENSMQKIRGEGCTPEEIQTAMRLFTKWEFVWKEPVPGACTLTTHHIDTGSAQSITHRARRLSPEKAKELQRQIQELLASGAIRSSTSPWSSPIVLVPKSNGTMRLCVDFRALNSVTVKDKYPLPRITELLDKLGAATIFSTFDLASGFHQVPLDEASKPKTAFVTPGGLYEYNVLPFGLANAPGTFQRVMDVAFQGFKFPEAIGIYLDDIVVFTSDVAHHFEVVEEVFRTLEKARLFINLQKTKICSRRVKYLGFLIGAGEMTPDPQQVAALRNLQPPKDVSGVRRFLGLTGYFRQFIPHFSEKALPLTTLLKKTTPFVWSPTCERSWNLLKQILISADVRLMLPLPGRMFTLDTDASTVALGTVLMQEDEGGKLRPLAFASRTLTPTERNWSTREQEAYAVVWGILHFAAYLRWQPHFLVRSDHQSLHWIWRSDNKRLIRWALLLQEYNFTLQYNKGKNHAHVDIFSRDVSMRGDDEKAAERVETKPHVFVAAPSPEERDTFVFPTFDDIREAQEEECVPAIIEELALRKGRQGLWENAGGKVFVPTKMRRPIMYFFHFGKMGVHQGVNKAFSRIRRLFWWPSLRLDLQEYHASYLTCVRRRPMPPLGHRGHLLAPHVGAIVAVDLVGPLKVRNNSVTFLSIIDHFSRYAHVVPLVEQDSEAIWNALFREWIAYFGAPIHLLSDNAPVFKSRAFLNKAGEHNIQRIYAFPYHPQGNGVVEAFHIFLKRSIVALLRQTSWPIERIIPTLLLAYRSTPHIATGETPFYLMTGMDMCIPGMQEWTPEALPDEPGGRLDTLHRIRQEAFDKMARAAVEKANGKTRRIPDATVLLPGSLVLHWLSSEERKSLSDEYGGRDAAPLWSGPCRLLRKSTTEKDTYIVQPLWERSKAKAYRRERLLPIPRTWGSEELHASLLELMADLKKPAIRYRIRHRKLPSVAKVPTTLQKQASENIEVVERELSTRMNQDDLPANDDEASEEGESELDTTRWDHWTDATRSMGQKRKKIYCLTWREVLSAVEHEHRQ